MKQQLLGASPGSDCLILLLSAMLVVVYASYVESNIHFCTCVSTTALNRGNPLDLFKARRFGLDGLKL